MSTISDIETALSVIAFGYTARTDEPSLNNFNKAYHSPKGQYALKENVSLLHCTSSYPTHFEDVNLHAMSTLAKKFGLRVGHSDHTIGIEVPVAAVALGATIIEKHFTLDKSLQGPDHSMSLAPQELIAMVKSIRHIELALGDGIKKPRTREQEMIQVMRRSLVAKEPIKVGCAFTIDNLCAKQPATGISPMQYWRYLGKHSSKQYEKDEIITEE